MAGNKHPWRDILTEDEWNLVVSNATRGDLLASTLKDRFLDLQAGKKLQAEIGIQIGLYHRIPKDDYTRFDERRGALERIAEECIKYLEHHVVARQTGQKSGPAEQGDAAGRQHKRLSDGIDVWVASLGDRAIKKREYLERMKMWHLLMKEKYQNPSDLVEFLWNLNQDNTRGSEFQFLHSTPYATIEKVDPYHRQTVVMMGDNQGDELRPHRGEMANAFRDYAMGRPPRLPDPRTRRHDVMSFYEWLEYHPICLGTPGVLGDAKYKYIDRIAYSGHDLAIATRKGGFLRYERTSQVGLGIAPSLLDTYALPPSRKGPKGSQAFVFTLEKSLLLHQHDGDFVHASAKEGHKIRCSGMLVAKNGKITTVTDQSGHYAPGQRHIQNFLYWLTQPTSCLDKQATVVFEVDGSVMKAGTYLASEFMTAALTKLGAPTLA